MIGLDRTRLIGLFFLLLRNTKMFELQKVLIILLVFSSTVATAQKQKKPRPRDKARANIVMLKGGALLVRLKTSDLKIKALKSKGMEKEAEQIRLTQEATNKAIVTAFWKEYHFSKVYFFYSTYSNEVKAGNLKGHLMDVNMEIDSSFTGQNFLIGEIDDSETTSIDAFVIKDKNYDQVNAPFPYLVKMNQALVTTRSYESVVKILNEKFFDYYMKQTP